MKLFVSRHFRIYTGAITCVYHWILGGGSCYIWGNATITWDVARITCSREGGHLLKVYDDDERRCIIPLVDIPLPRQRVWIGGHLSQNTRMMLLG